METLGKTLVALGLALALVGGTLWLFGRGGGGALPGDIVVQRKNVTFYFPIVTCLLMSVAVSLILWLFRR